MTKTNPINSPSPAAPREWVKESAGLFMRADAEDSGRLVRLADVVLWLIDEKELPRIKAVELLADTLEAASYEPPLYLAQSGNYAMLVEGDAARFGYHTAESWAAEQVRDAELFQPISLTRDSWSFERHSSTELAFNRAYAGNTVAKPEFVTHGVPALLRRIRESWTRKSRGPATTDEIFFAHPRLEARAVAVRIGDAAVIWGWGFGGDSAAVEPASPFPLADWKALIAYRDCEPRPSWADGNQLDVARAEFKKRGGEDSGKKTKVLKEMGEELKQTHQSLARALFGERKRKANLKRASPMPTVETRKRNTG